MCVKAEYFQEESTQRAYLRKRGEVSLEMFVSKSI